MNATQHVWFNDGQTDQYALVKHDHGGGNLDLIVFTEPGVEVKNGVPHREPADYDAHGGGDTWHD